jgi:malate synthase
MAAFIPSRRDPEINEIALRKVREDKSRESADGCDGTWVAHPDLVPPVLEVFDAVLGDKPNQLDVLRDDVKVEAGDLLNTAIEGGRITEAGLRTNISVAVLYLESWLRGTGAAALFNLMEDAATAEISRSQIWQWIRHDALMDDGRPVTRELVHELVIEEMDKMAEAYGEDLFARGRFDEARHLFETVALSDEFPEFLTLKAYELID